VYLGDQLGTYGCLIILAVITISIIFPPFAGALALLAFAFVWMVVSAPWVLDAMAFAGVDCIQI
jgi:hypothetical protein